jgi:hypothetical protein
MKYTEFSNKKQGVAEGFDNPYKEIDPNAWHLIQGDRPIAINFPDEYRAKSFHSGHGYGRETKILHGSQVRQNAYLKHNPGVINYPEYSKGVAEATGDPKFDAMMRDIKKGTAKQRTADRKAERAASQAQAKAAFGNMFGTSGESPADKLSIRKDVKEVSDQTLINYLTKVNADSQKHRSDPTKRSPEKASRSVAGFSRAFNKLDARKATELAPRVGESTEEDRQHYEQAARDVVKGADPDHIARVRKLDPETLRSHVDHAWERVNSGEYKLNRPNLEETDLESVVNAQQGGMPLVDVNEARESCPECGGPMFPALVLGEKQDACYYKVKSRYKVWPSAYASGALVQCRKKGAANWGNKGK